MKAVNQDGTKSNRKKMEELLSMWNENFGDHEADGFIGTIERISVALLPFFLMFLTLLITGGSQH